MSFSKRKQQHYQQRQYLKKQNQYQQQQQQQQQKNIYSTVSISSSYSSHSLKSSPLPTTPTPTTLTTTPTATAPPAPLDMTVQSGMTSPQPPAQPLSPSYATTSSSRVAGSTTSEVGSVLAEPKSSPSLFNMISSNTQRLFSFQSPQSPTSRIGGGGVPPSLESDSDLYNKLANDDDDDVVMRSTASNGRRKQQLTLDLADDEHQSDFIVGANRSGSIESPVGTVSDIIKSKVCHILETKNVSLSFFYFLLLRKWITN